jgi:phage head maturation protease
MSFGFVVQQDSWNKDRTERLVKRAQLLEVSIVQDAAYPQTSSSLRSVSAAYLDAANLRLALHFRRMADHVR